jgi:hypothetical protein
MTTLTVHNAEIRTATVEIKTLTVSGKQVTLAVFRQLREEPLIGDDGTLNGTPWGTVNYHPDKCGDEPGVHRHVVWQRGTDLLRSRIDEPSVYARYATRLATDIAEKLIVNGAEPDQAEERGLGSFAVFYKERPPVARFIRRGVRFMTPISQSAADHYRFGGTRTDAAWRDRQAAITETVEQLAERLPIDAYMDAWHASADLPQLFIAV